MATRRTVLGLGTAAVAVCALIIGVTTAANAIANGSPVPEGHYRFAVKLKMTHIPRPDGTFYDSGCSAALIAPQWIITAGHCFHDVNRVPVSGLVPYDTVATIGRTDDADTNGDVVHVVEDYQATGTDMSIAKLARPVFDVAPLLLRITAPTVGQILRMTGWGTVSDTNPVMVTHLQTGQVKVSSVTDSTVGVVGYAPQSTTSSCLYDSGMPYFYEPPHGPPQLVSVESNGPQCPHDQEETTARTDNRVIWILQTIAAHTGR
jgi:secreted trypsin-like serine protease